MVLRQTPPEALTNYRRTRHIAEVKILALQGDEADALAALRRAVDGGWRDLWWQAQTDPTLTSISEHPEFMAALDEVKADMAAQLERVREMERNGELAPMPEVAAAQ